MKKILLSVLAACIALGSCNDFLDVQPKGELIPTTMEDYELLLNSFDMMTTSEYNVLQYFSDDAYWPDMLISIMQAIPMLYKAYTWEKDIYAADEDDRMWTGSYSRIFTYNTIIEKIMDSRGGSSAQKESIRAEALLGRAVEYFNLVNTYGPAYTPQSRDTRAVPLVLTDDAAQQLVRNTVGEVYDRIIKDLLDAEKVLPDRPKLSSTYRGSRAGAWAMLSRVGLYTGDWEMAAEYAGKVLAQHNTLLDYNDYRVIDDTKENGRTNLPRLRDNPEVFYVRHFSDYPLSVSGLAWITPDLEALYVEGDRRLDLWFSYHFPMMGLNLPWLNYAAYYQLCVTPAVPELLLTRAEACVRLGGAANREKALADLNRLRRNRFEPARYRELASSDDAEALHLILDERRRELVYMCLRIYDLKRLNLDPVFAKDLTRTVDGTALTLPANSPLYVMSISSKVADYHPEWFE